MDFQDHINELRRRLRVADAYDEFNSEAEAALDSYAAGCFAVADTFGMSAFDVDKIVRDPHE